MKTKFFLAIEPPEEIKKRLASLRVDIPARWTPKENIHLTLFYIGHLNKELIGEVINSLKMITKNINEFPLKVNGTSYYPHQPHPPKMLWATIANSKPLKQLQKKISETLVIKINPKSNREIGDFLPHITLARINSWKFKQLEEEERPSLPEEAFFFEVNSISLMESRVIKGKAKYQLIEKFKLK